MIKDWEEILNTAIIGTDKKQVNVLNLSDALKQAFESIESQTSDKELQFLNICSVVSGYRKAGFLPSGIAADPITECPPETIPHCNSNAVSSLQAALDDENNSLLFYWLTKCNEGNRIITPEYIPLLFEKAEKDKELRNLIIECAGVRGKWMAQFNQAWKFEQTELSFQEMFDHGTLEERKTALLQWRTQSPEEARMALEKTWNQEQAATKADLLSALHINLSLNDEPFIKEIWKEKSQKVKEVALRLLKQLPGSFIVEEIWNFVKPLISYKKSSSMLGLLNKESIEINLSFQIPDIFKTYGISHLDADKIFSEKEFTLNQLIAIVPPLYWEDYFKLNANDILSLFEKRAETKKFIEAFARSADTYKNVEWAKVLYLKHQKLCMSVVKEFEEELQQQIVLQDAQNLKDIFHILSDWKKEWSLEFSFSLVKKTAQEPYTYTKVFYKNIVHHFPVELAEKLDKIDINDPVKQAYWVNINEEIKRMLAIKQQIKQSF